MVLAQGAFGPAWFGPSPMSSFTGTSGAYVPIAETIRGFKEIIDGEHDDVPESAFFLKGTIDDVVKAASGKKDE